MKQMIQSAGFLLVGVVAFNAYGANDRNATVRDTNTRTSTTTTTTDVDADARTNTTYQEGIRPGQAPVTADQQGAQPAADVEITRLIRQRLTDDSSLSTAAQNVTIVTADNTVTISGPVRSSRESERIAAAAKAVAPGKVVKNEMTVRR